MSHSGWFPISLSKIGDWQVVTTNFRRRSSHLGGKVNGTARESNSYEDAVLLFIFSISRLSVFTIVICRMSYIFSYGSFMLTSWFYTTDEVTLYPSGSVIHHFLDEHSIGNQRTSVYGRIPFRNLQFHRQRYLQWRIFMWPLKPLSFTVQVPKLRVKFSVSSPGVTKKLKRLCTKKLRCSTPNPFDFKLGHPPTQCYVWLKYRKHTKNYISIP